MIQDIEIEEAERYENEKKTRPLPVRVKFSNLKDKNTVLKSGRKLKGKVKISEEFTEKDRNARKHLADYAKKNSKSTKQERILKFHLSNLYAFLGADGHCNKTSFSSMETYMNLILKMKL